MRDFRDVIGGYQALKADAERMQAEVKTRAQDHLLEAQALIIARAETTGSPLHDGVIALYGAGLLDNPGIVDKYESVDSQLKGKSGQPVVMIHRQLKTEGCTGFGGAGYETMRTYIALGVIDKEDLVFDFERRTCSVSILRLAELDNRGSQMLATGGMLLTITSNMSWMLRLDLAAELDEALEPSGVKVLGGPFEVNADKMTLAVGHEGIAKWLISNEGEDTTRELLSVRKLCRELGINPIEPLAGHQQAIVGYEEANSRDTVSAPGL